MPLYEKAKPNILEIISGTMETYHGGLHDVEVLIDVLMATPSANDNGDLIGPAIMVNGYQAAACIKILSYKQRVARGFDAELIIDADQWETWTDKERIAVIDHELTHLELSIDDKGGVKRDDADRPKMRSKKHDRQLGWFDSVAKRHGSSSLEVTQCHKFLESQEYRQCYLFELEEAAA